MTIIINSKTTKEEFERLVQQFPKKGFDARKYCGLVKFKEDGLALQKQWRNEWR